MTDFSVCVAIVGNTAEKWKRKSAEAEQTFWEVFWAFLGRKKKGGQPTLHKNPRLRLNFCASAGIFVQASTTSDGRFGKLILIDFDPSG